jgi:hypothetical protein
MRLIRLRDSLIKLSSFALVTVSFANCVAPVGTTDPGPSPTPEVKTEITSVTPASGPAFGGTAIKITGKAFQAKDVIRVGGENCLQLKWVSATEMDCVTSRHILGAADIVVLRQGSNADVTEATLANGFTYKCVSPQPSGISIWTNTGEDKVTQDDLRATCDPQNLSNSVWDGTKISLFGAKDEVVNFNMIIESPSTASNNLSYSFDTLAGPGGSLIRSFGGTGDQVFDWNNRNIENFYVRYLQIKGLSFLSYEHYDERHVPQRMERPVTSIGDGVGTWLDRPDHDKYYPDIAVPMELQPTFNIARAQNQSVWTDIYIPKDATPGLYTGSVSISQNGTVIATVPVQLTVRNFSMLNQPAAKTMVFMGDDQRQRYLGADPFNPGDGAYLQKVRDRHFQLAHRHRLTMVDANLGYGPWADDSPRPDWLPRLDGSLFTSAQGYVGPNAGQPNNTYAIGMYNTWNWQGGTEQDMRTHLDAWEQWFRTNAPSAERFLFISDEPRAQDLPTAERFAQWVKNNPGIGKNIKSFGAMSLLDAVASVPSLDMVSSLLAVADPATWNTALSTLKSRNSRASLSMYNGKRPASGGFDTEDDGVSLRELAWGQYKKGVDRWFYWESTYYNNYQGNMGQTNLFKTAQTIGSVDPTSGDTSVLGQTGYNYTNGDGVLFYPGTDKLFPSDSYNINGPIASLRMKHWRRGIQDVDYLTMANAINPTRTQQIVNAMVPRVLWETGVADPKTPNYLRAGISWSVDPNDWESARKQLADIIEGR